MLPATVHRCDGARVVVGRRPLAEPCRQCLRRTDIPIDLSERDGLRWFALAPAEITPAGWRCDKRIEAGEATA